MAVLKGSGASRPTGLTRPKTTPLRPSPMSPPDVGGPRTVEYPGGPTMQPISGNVPSGAPIVPVAGVSVADLVDSYGAARSGGRSHKGIDIFADSGTPVIAAVAGTVVKAGDSGGLGGLRVWVVGDDGRYHYYAHLNQVNVNVGMRVGPGQMLGTVGQTGNAAGTPPHLHYSVNTSPDSETGDLNPYLYLQKGTTVGAEMPFASFTFPWVPGNLQLDSDDLGPFTTGEFQEPSLDDIAHDSLFALSQIVAGGQSVDPSRFFVPLDLPERQYEAETNEGGPLGYAGGLPVFDGQSTGNPDRDFIISRESSFLPTADNPKSTAFGLGQLLEANRQAYGQQLGFDPNTTDPMQQLAMMDAYVADRYGTYAAARAFWEQNNWY